MSKLKETLAKQIPQLRQERKDIIDKWGEHVVGEVTVEQLFGGMRGIKSVVCDTSVVEPDDGVIIRGIPIAKLQDRLPEEILWLMLTGKLPSADELKDLQTDLKNRTSVPAYVFKLIDELPDDTHPMTLLNTAILGMQRESKFAKAYMEGLSKTDHWQAVLEDSLNLIAGITSIAAYVYHRKYRKGSPWQPDQSSDWAGSFARMLQISKTEEFEKMMRLYMTLHADHEGGNVSAFTCQVAASALADPYYSVSAGLNGLAGPLHGLANQESLRFLLEMQREVGERPSDDAVRKYVWDLLNAKRVIPGYGHAVLRSTDPRFVALYDFGSKRFAKDPLFDLMARCYRLVPEILLEQGKVKSPYPNVDAGSGVILWHYGLKQFDYYTVLFSVSRALGMLAQTILNRALMTPILRPKSVSTAMVQTEINKSFATHVSESVNAASHLSDPQNQVWHQHGFVEERPSAAPAPH